MLKHIFNFILIIDFFKANQIYCNMCAQIMDPARLGWGEGNANIGAGDFRVLAPAMESDKFRFEAHQHRGEFNDGQFHVKVENTDNLAQFFGVNFDSVSK